MLKDKNDPLLSLVNSSGYLFQLRVEHEIKQSSSEHGWDVVSREHPWKDAETDTDGFIDLVLEQRYSHQRMVVECKRPQDANWVFLVPNDEPEPFTTRTRCAWLDSGKDRKPISGWDDLDFLPNSFESAFCIIRGTGERDHPMLERLSKLLLKSVECLQEEELELYRAQFPHVRIYLPAILTTAELKICRFDLGRVSLKDGKISSAKFESVPFVRFRKSLKTELTPNAKPSDLQEANRDKERTILVINAMELTRTLREWQFDKRWDRGPGPWQLARERETSSL